MPAQDRAYIKPEFIMSKLLSVLIAAAFTTVTFTAIAADASMAAPAAKTEAATPAKEAAKPAQKASKKSAKAEKLASCKKDAKEQKLKGKARRTFIKDCMSKESTPVAKADTATLAAKK
jgi:psiF repeat